MRTQKIVSWSGMVAGAWLAVACGGADETRLERAEGETDVGASSAGIARAQALTPSIPIPPPLAERLRSERSWGRWRELGPIEVMPEGTKANLALARRESSERPKADDTPEAREATFVVDDLVGRMRYQGRYDWEGIFTHEELKAARENDAGEPAEGDAERLEAQESKGWSGGLGQPHAARRCRLGHGVQSVQSVCVRGLGLHGQHHSANAERHLRAHGRALPV